MTVVIDEPHQFGIKLTCSTCNKQTVYTCTVGTVSGHGTTYTESDVAFAKQHLLEDKPLTCRECERREYDNY